MQLLTEELLTELLGRTEQPCLSLYMPTHTKHPDNKQDPTRYKKLVKELEKSLLNKYSSGETAELLKPFHKLAEDYSFWQHTIHGLAVLSSKNSFYTIGLFVPVNELAVVSDSFHTKPLRKYLQSVQAYQVLAINMKGVSLFEGNRHRITEVELEGKVPTTITEALGEELTEKYLTVSTGGGSASGNSHIHHGHGSKSDEVQKDAERYFTVVSRAVEEHFSKPQGLPLILAALPEHHHIFKKVSNNPHLLDEGITVNPQALNNDQLRIMSWEIIEPKYLDRLKKQTDRFQQAKAEGIGSDVVQTVSEAAATGRVDTLLLEESRVIAGHVDEETGEIQKGELSNPEIEDVLDDIGELVTKKGGQVLIIPADLMPTNTGIAAIFRF